jgi:proteasome lid subunit RPN8/RPN11
MLRAAAGRERRYRGGSAAGQCCRGYFIEPAAYLKVLRAARQRSLDVIGVYHSHPRSTATPSPTDAAEGFSNFIFLIVGLAAKTPELTAWTWADGNFTPMPIVRSP